MLDSVYYYLGKEIEEVDGKEYDVTDYHTKLVKETERKEYCLKKIKEMYSYVGCVSIEDYNIISEQIFSNKIKSKEIVHIFYNKLLTPLKHFACLYAKTDLPKYLFEDAIANCYCVLLSKIKAHANSNKWFKTYIAYTTVIYRVVDDCLEKFQKENGKELYCEIGHSYNGNERIKGIVTPEKIVSDYADDYVWLEFLFRNGELKKISKEFYDDLSEDAIVVSDEGLNNQFNQDKLKETVNEVLDTLSQREETVLRLRYGIDDNKPRTLSDIAKEFGVTKTRIQQIEARALRKLRGYRKKKRLAEFKEI